MKKTNKVICVILPIIVLIVVFCLLWGIFSNNINASNLEKLGTFVTLKQENDGRYYGVEISGSSNHGPAVYEFNNGYLLKKDYNNQNVKDSYTVRVINDTAFVVKDEDEFEDMTLTIVNYDSSTGILELSENGDIIYCYPYDKVDFSILTKRIQNIVISKHFSLFERIFVVRAEEYDVCILSVPYNLFYKGADRLPFLFNRHIVNCNGK